MYELLNDTYTINFIQEQVKKNILRIHNINIPDQNPNIIKQMLKDVIDQNNKSDSEIVKTVIYDCIKIIDNNLYEQNKAINAYNTRYTVRENTLLPVNVNDKSKIYSIPMRGKNGF